MSPRALSAAFSIALLLNLLTANVFAQQAEFNSIEREGCFPLTVNFFDTSAGSSDWHWDFGNGNTSTFKNPQAIYSAPGSYNVSLTVTIGGLPKTIIRAGYIVVHDYPSVNFSFNISSGCAPLSVKFNDLTSTASGQIASWQWVFGDGGISGAANPQYVFKEPGSRTVTLRAKNEFGCEKVKSAESPITVNGPVTKFAVDKTAVCTTPATFQFTNQTTGNNLTYQWTFGDGQTSTAISPSHTYNSAGVFNVVLKARDGNGCETTFQRTLNAGSEGGLDFTASSLKVCLNQTVDFTLVSLVPADAAVNALWTFGDGGTSTSTNDEQHAWSAPGTYTITLNALLLNHTCNSVVTKTITVVAPATPSFKQSSDCNYNLTLTSTSLNAVRLEWFINNEFASAAQSFVSPVHAPGGQELRLVAYDDAGCSNTLETVVSMFDNPSPAFTPTEQQSCTLPSLSGCAPFDIQFENKTIGSDIISIKWEFGDGITANADKPKHTYISKGLFQVALTATNSRGCSKTTTAFVIVANQAPVPKFTINTNVACAGEEVKFTDQSTGADFWCWDFGDNTKGVGKEVIHKYAMPGTYTVKLLSKNAGCSAEVTMPNVITIKNPYVDFTFHKTCNDPFTVTLGNLSKNYNTIEWDFGDGETSTVVNVGSHHYDDEGTYTLRLIGKNDTTGCTTIAFAPIIIQKVEAVFQINPGAPCKDAFVNFHDESKAPFKWEWSIAGTNFTNQHPSTKIKIPGAYNATLKVTDSDGCTSTTSKPFTVLDLQGEFTFEQVSTCDKLAVAFKNESTGTPPLDFTWDFGDGITSTDRDPSHDYHAVGKYNVSLTLKNVLGTCTLLRENAVNFTIPVPGFETAKTDHCPNETILVANTSKNALTYEWDYGDGRRSDFVGPPIVYTETGSYDVTLFAKDLWGCERKISKQEFIKVDKPNADFSIASSTGSCPPFTGVFTDKSKTDIKGWEWDFGDGHQSIIQSPANVYLTPGSFNVKLTVTDQNNCTDTKTANQFVTVGGPTGSFTNSGANSCTNKLISFSANVVNTAKLRWDFGDGTVVDRTDHDVDHVYTSVGSFTPQLLLIDGNGCQTVAGGSQVFFVKDTTIVSMKISPACIGTGEKFLLKGANEQDDEDLMWVWEVDGSSGAGADSYEATIDQPGAYAVRGQAVNAFGCVSNVVDTVRIQGPVTLIPNVITPNSDGSNDQFRIKGLESSTWNIDIVNRWGNTVYSRDDYRGEWDGGEQPAGVYFFVLRNAICNDVNHKGYISLTR